MPGGAGSPINLLDHRASTTSTECANSDEDERTTGTLPSMMTTVLAGDGLRRRKVIHAAKETLDKGESAATFRSLSLTLSQYPHNTVRWSEHGDSSCGYDAVLNGSSTGHRRFIGLVMSHASRCRCPVIVTGEARVE